MKDSSNNSVADMAKSLSVSASELDIVLFQLKSARECCDRMDVCFEIKYIRHWLSEENSCRSLDDLPELSLADIGTSEEELSRLVQTGIASFESEGNVHLVDSNGECNCARTGRYGDAILLAPLPEKG